MSSARVERIRAALESFLRSGEIPAGAVASDFELIQADSIVDTAWVWSFDGDDEAQRLEIFEEPSEALESVGLSAG